MKGCESFSCLLVDCKTVGFFSKSVYSRVRRRESLPSLALRFQLLFGCSCVLEFTQKYGLFCTLVCLMHLCMFCSEIVTDAPPPLREL